MAIIKEELTTLNSIVNFLSEMKDKNGTNYFTSVEKDADTLPVNITIKTAESGDNPFVVLNFHTYGSDTVGTITYYTQTETYSGSMGEYNTSAITLSVTEGVKTSNGMVLNFRKGTTSLSNVAFVGFGKSKNGKIFLTKGTFSSYAVNNGVNLLSHIYSAVDNYIAVETHHSVNYPANTGSTLHYANQTLLATEGFAIGTDEPADMWNNYYFNKMVQTSGQGIMTLNGKSYYTNSYISILDD